MSNGEPNQTTPYSETDEFHERDASNESRSSRPRSPSDRSVGDGWQICHPIEKSDWATVGCDAQSCFLFLYNVNRHNDGVST